MKDDPIVFVAVTYEPRDAIEAFIRRRAVPGWVALDTDESEIDRFGIQSVPNLRDY